MGLTPMTIHGIEPFDLKIIPPSPKMNVCFKKCIKKSVHFARDKLHYHCSFPVSQHLISQIHLFGTNSTAFTKAARENNGKLKFFN